ncbi:folate-binding protein [Galactobacter caseinivorans]|uniref:Folate-binding protein n=1 Tax=Galactobacter caseinivorans TaxID=2676123 RepID=A0A496PN50_9MICC|nr:glycine cleavage T C-terminal barrel domain-containing protein [Galactobacter caseinivorans]RKW71952.1 folate-binding protein [Galactobacter caseinivorans]
MSWPGAVNEGGADAGIPAHYGAPLREGRALADGQAFVDLSTWGVVTMTGPDRLRLLHSLSSQGLDRLAEQTPTRTLFLDLQGRIEFDARVIDDGTTSFLIVEPHRAGALAAWLDSMRFMMRVEVADATQQWAVAGSNAEWTLDGADLGPRWVDPWPQVQPGGYPYSVVEEHPGAENDWRLDLIPRDQWEQVAKRLVAEAGLSPAGLMAAEQLRVAAWEPSQAHEMDHKSIPHELDLLRTAVHMNKGCYKGQETVARVHNLGHPPRRLVFLDLDGMEHTVPSPGAPILADGRTIGSVTSAVLHHEAGPIALAVIRRNVDPSLTLVVQDGDTSYAAAQTTIVAPDAGSVVGRPQGIRRL